MKTLLKYKIKTILPALIIGAIVLAGAVIMVFVDFSEFHPYENWFGTFFIERIAGNLSWLPYALLPLALIMGIILTKDYGGREREEFLKGLPYRKNTIFIASILPGVVFFLVFLVVMIIAIVISYCISYQHYSEINMLSSNYELIMKMDSLGNAVLHIVQVMLTILMLYFFAVFSGVVSKLKIIPILILAMICLFPMIVPEAINIMAKNYFDTELPMYAAIKNYSGLTGMFYNSEQVYFFNCLYTYFLYPVERTVTSGIIMVIFAVLSYVMAVKADRIQGKIVAGKVTEWIFIGVAGIYGACLVPIFGFAEKLNFGVIIVLMVVVFVLVAGGISRFINGKGKYNYLNAGGKKK